MMLPWLKLLNKAGKSLPAVPLKSTVHGAPIIPMRGDVVVAEGKPYQVTHALWNLDNEELTVFASEI